jgi:ubiquinone/menaquinone biosynthesis C-methylase UbiE
MPKITGCILLNILRDSQIIIPPKSNILDFGCGNGDTVKELSDLGFIAKGCDFKFKEGVNVNSLIETDCLHKISTNPYRLPYPDQSFDFLISNQVMEHVHNYSETIAEMSRVLKPEGVCIHIFPSRFKILESHVHIPFASIIRNYYYLYFWVLLGFRKENDKCNNAKDLTIAYQTYLNTSTNYLSNTQILESFKSEFLNVFYGEKFYLKNSPSQRGRRLYSIALYFPLIFFIFRVLVANVIIASNRTS